MPQSRLAATQPIRDPEYVNTLYRHGYTPRLLCEQSHNERHRARVSVAHHPDTPQHIREAALHDLHIHGQRTFTRTCKPLHEIEAPKQQLVEQIPDILTETITFIITSPKNLFNRFLDIRNKLVTTSASEFIAKYGCDHSLICFCYNK